MKPGRSDHTKKAAVPLNNYQFDFGLGTGSRSHSGSSLKEQKHSSSSSLGSGRSSSLPTQSSTTAASWASHPSSAPPVNPSKPQQGFGNWTKAGGWQTGQQSQSMVGDITGKSWAKADGGSKAAGSIGVGVVGGLGSSKADMFGDLLGTPFARSAAPSLKPSSASQTPSFSVAALGSALPKGPSLKDSMRSKTEPPVFPVPDPSATSVENPLSSSGFAAPSAASGDADAFGDFFGPPSNPTSFFQDPFPSSSHVSQEKPINADPFDFLQRQGSASADTFSSGPIGGEGFKQPTSAAGDGLLGSDFMPDLSFSSHVKPTNTPQSNHPHDLLSDMFASGSSATFDPIASIFGPQKPSSVKKQPDPLEALWSRSVSAAPIPPQSQPLQTADDWGIEDNIGVGTQAASTTELEELPPPPVGVNVVIAKNKGAEYYKQGQFPDAIKWLTWAVSLCESSESSATLGEILTCRVSCYKEVGEYKKAVADCFKTRKYFCSVLFCTRTWKSTSLEWQT
ncbi:hypothetical protein O6H91_02G037800 [Diphasiastrum complanatum]|uniref:Uncharacterized protein n=1 Tax=Diphasiastrum complanatum TaxID=34168 RepID=A0ACC2EEU4_DIPCM|nr:hypothetical protein O6H91_02G037800 [Diphasiastrum complanatum]